MLGDINSPVRIADLAQPRDDRRGVFRVVGRFGPLDVRGVERSCAGTRVPSVRLYGWT